MKPLLMSLVLLCVILSGCVLTRPYVDEQGIEQSAPIVQMVEAVAPRLVQRDWIGGAIMGGITLISTLFAAWKSRQARQNLAAAEESTILAELLKPMAATGEHSKTLGLLVESAAGRQNERGVRTIIQGIRDNMIPDVRKTDVVAEKV